MNTGEFTGRILDLKMIKFVLFGCLVLLAGVKSAAVETVNGDVVVDTVERSIDISSQLVKINTKLTLTNNGKGAISGFHYGLEEAAKAKLAFIGATVSYRELIIHCLMLITVIITHRALVSHGFTGAHPFEN